MESLTTEWSLVPAGKPKGFWERQPLPPPPVCRWGRCIKESFSGWKQTPVAAHTEIFVTNCRISCRKMEMLLTLFVALTFTTSGKKNTLSSPLPFPTCTSFHWQLVSLRLKETWEISRCQKNMKTSQTKDIRERERIIQLLLEDRPPRVNYCLQLLVIFKSHV